MDEHFTLQQQGRQARQAGAQMLHTDECIRKNQSVLRRRGTGSRAGSLLPRADIPLATLALRKGLQGLPEQGAALQRTAQLLGASQEFIDERDGAANGQKKAATPDCVHLGIIW